MDREKRSELAATLESQREQISRYETRFRDVVKAYKSVLKEKEALESTVRALSVQSKEEGDDESETESQSGVAALSDALATLTEEKSKIVSDFQADKKEMRNQFETNLREAKSEKERLEKIVERSKDEIEELKSRLRQQQIDLEGEMNDHVAMLRELQQVLATERDEKEEMETQLEDFQRRVILADSEVEDLKEKTDVFKCEISELKKRLRAAETRAKESSQPQPLVLQMQKEIADLKASHAVALLAEQQRANEIEKQLQRAKQREEERVSSLENRVSELSDVIGGIEKSRENDRAVILKLKSNQSENAALKADDNRQISQLKGLLAEANSKVERLFSEKESRVINNETGLDQSEIDYKREYERLQDEMYQLKRRATDAKSLGKSSNIERLLKEREDLQHQINSLTTLNQQKEEAYRKEIVELHEERQLLQRKHVEALDIAEKRYQSSLSDLQQSVQNTRERTRVLLADKDSEMLEMKSRLLRKSSSYLDDWEPELPSPDAQSPSKIISYSELLKKAPNVKSHPGKVKQLGADVAVRELLSLPKLTSQAEMSLLHYAEQQSKREAGMCAMRRERLELEQGLRDASEREDKYVEQLALLKEEIRKLERDRSRETANMEYLKNVIYKLLLSDPATPIYTQLVNALATILHFSPEEIKRLKKPKGWW
ncbi:GRIP and coiled-coil domain-containing protein 1-like [Oscarella lobularis]|uniref:GRIP and coiled-coil domain-containing protein 1-like n=1 Tax=Oscarella lobularis TaxID=121494 RepID=UPI0033140D7F